MTVNLTPKLECAMRVLVVDDDSKALTCACNRLIALGCDVSTARSAQGLVERVEREHPDLVLIDILTRGVEGDDLFLLLARCPPNTLPAVVVHTRILPALLPRIIDINDVLGVVRKTDNDDEFFAAFQSVVDRAAALVFNAPASRPFRTVSGEFPTRTALGLGLDLIRKPKVG
jgi:CheY-like chemotaxis protein